MDKCSRCSGTGKFTFRKKVKDLVNKETGEVLVREYEKNDDGTVKIYSEPCSCTKEKPVKKKVKKEKGE